MDNKKELIDISKKLNDYINQHQEEFLSQGKFLDISFSSSESKNELYIITESGSSKIHCDFEKLKSIIEKGITPNLIIDIYKNDGDVLNQILDFHLNS